MHNPNMQTYLEENLPHYLDLLHQMVDINSFTGNPEGVNHLGRFTAQRFADLGFSAEFVSSVNPDFGKHLILTRPGKSGRTIGCISHLDTVFPPEDEVRNNFSWRVEGERIYGPGSNDIKGGTIALYMMLDALRTFAPTAYDDITWVLLFDSSEEDLADDFGELCRSRLAANNTLAALIFEAGFTSSEEFWIVRSRKGMGVFTVNVEGKSAHAGSAHQFGANAIVQMADVVQQLASFTDYTRDVTVNVGKIGGGTVTNRVPHHAEARLEMRAFAPDVFQATLDQIMGLNGRSTIHSIEDNYPCQTAVELVRITRPWPRNEGTENLFRIWAEAATQFGRRAVPEDRGGLSDGNHIWDIVPCIDGLGISGANAHCSERSADGSKDQEYCLPASLVPKTMLNVTAVLKLISA
ncbi:MAG: M20/M25/M40 family metallo-hydrolase [Anaerolineales bacterium]|nr:M20/M25/M40 family metallo-hydrolase [Anaerolineales bacterium]